MQDNSNSHGTKKGVSVIGAVVIALLLVIAVIYGLYTFQSYSSSSANFSALLGGNPSNSNNAYSGTGSIVNVYGNATVLPSNGECGGGGYPVSVTFNSTQNGASYVANVPNARNFTSGNYSTSLRNNNRYIVTIQVKNRCVPASSQTAVNCSAGILNLSTTLPSEHVDVSCGSNPVVITSSSTTASASSSSSTTSVNTQIDSTCITQATASTTAASTTQSTTSTSSSTSTSSVPCSVLKTLASKGQLLTNPSVNGTTFFFGAYFNFTKDTTAANFTLTGSFTSNSNFTLLISYGSSTHGTQSLAATQESNGNYTLNLNQQVPIGPHYSYQITMVFTPYAPKQTALVTSDFNIVTCAPAQLQMFGIT
jgi:hypothetical protein